jgi:hypothetical protein
VADEAGDQAMIWLWLLAYLPATFMAHNLIHEGAHWAVIRACGGKATIIPWPHRAGGKLYFARTLWSVPVTFRDTQFLAAYFAPVVAELVWLAGACFAFGYTDLAAFEAAAALVDIAAWFIGSDGHQAARMLR